MNKIPIFAALIVFGIFALGGCGQSGADNASFTGVWNGEDENGISGAKDTQRVTVMTDGNGFKITTEDPTGESIAAYNGETLYRKFTPSPTPAGSTESAPEPAQALTDQSETASKMKTMPLRFWTRTYEGKGVPGGQVAGQDTILYQARENRPDGDIIAQAWVDAKTGVVLKSVDTIYSKQVDSMVSKVSRTCESIQYGPVDKSAFAKP